MGKKHMTEQNSFTFFSTCLLIQWICWPCVSGKEYPPPSISIKFRHKHMSSYHHLSLSVWYFFTFHIHFHIHRQQINATPGPIPPFTPPCAHPSLPYFPLHSTTIKDELPISFLTTNFWSTPLAPKIVSSLIISKCDQAFAWREMCEWVCEMIHIHIHIHVHIHIHSLNKRAEAILDPYQGSCVLGTTIIMYVQGNYKKKIEKHTIPGLFVHILFCCC